MTKTFKEAYYFFRKNVVKLSGFTFLITVLVVLIAELLMPFFFASTALPESPQEVTLETIEPLAQMMNIFIKPIYTGALIVLIYSLATEQNKSLVNCLSAGVIRWPFMLIANMMTSFLIFIGFLVFILPGIWLFTRLFLVPYLVMLNNQSPLDAIINSYKYTQGYSFTLLNDLVILVFILIFCVFTLSVLQLLQPFLLLLLLLLFQTMAHVVYYRHYEILLNKQ